MNLHMRKNRKKILIVDDEEDITWSIEKGLQKDKTLLNVFCTNNGSSALDIMSNCRMDLLVTDIRMPGVNGRQLFEQVRQKHPDLKIIVMTAFGSRDVNEWLNGLGIDRVIEKPFEISELRNLILSVVRAKQYRLKNKKTAKGKISGKKTPIG